MVVVDFPSPSGVGVMPATTTYFPLLQVGELNFKKQKEIEKKYRNSNLISIYRAQTVVDFVDD